MSVAPDNPAVRYRAVNRSAVLSLIFGGLSIVLVLAWPFVAFPIAAVYLGWRALKQIDRTREEMTGEGLAWTGIGLAGLFFLVGSGWLLLARGREVPHGYQRVDYPELQPDPTVPDEVVPPKIKEMEGQKVFIRGYMSPTRQQVGLKKFLLCPMNGDCQFCTPNPKPTEVIRVKLVGDLTTHYTRDLVRVGGRLHVDSDEPKKAYYSLDVDYLR